MINDVPVPIGQGFQHDYGNAYQSVITNLSHFWFFLNETPNTHHNVLCWAI